jgi:VPDSG-CTERM motif
MKKFLTFALLTMGLILNAGAQTTNFLPPAPVPDPGSTAVLLGIGLAALAAVYRKKDQT